jgi:hypothetical protein
MRILHHGGSIILARGLAEYLGIVDLIPNLGLTPKGNRRHSRRGAAVPGQPYTVQLDDLSQWTIGVTGTLKAFEEAYFISRPTKKLVRAWSPNGTEIMPRTGLT